MPYREEADARSEPDPHPLDTTQPRPFGPLTIELGHYIGMRRQGMLVAMAGERMRAEAG